MRLLEILYRCVVVLRGWLYDSRILKSYRSPIPVISVGNVTAGGNGKTPLCLALAYEMRKRGYSPAILSRGYGGSRRGPYRVQPGDRCGDVGDEAVLMAEAGIPVYIARKRVAGIKLIERDPAINLVILDDGLQHRALARSLDIVSIFVGSSRAIDEFVAGHLLPRGMFREPRHRALRRAQMIVLSYRTVEEPSAIRELDPRIVEILPHTASVFRSFLTPAAVTSLATGQAITPGKVCALAAIGNPEGFFQSLESMGYQIRERFVFPDHHIFSVPELERVFARFPNEVFVCTLKDAVKLRELPEHIQTRFASLSVTAHIVPSDAFFVQVERAIQGGQHVAQAHKVMRL